jgi:serine/threonine-protein kinase RsbW
MCVLSFHVRKNRFEQRQLRKTLEDFSQLHHLPPKIAFVLQLSLEELITNCIKHSESDCAHSIIEINLLCKPGLLVIEMEDESAPFNPLEAGIPDTEISIEDRKVGGLGIHLLRSLMDEIQYERTGEKNYIRLKKYFDYP